MTPEGRYVCNRAPYGISSICEVYNRRMDDVVRNLPGARKIVDDVLIYGKDLETLFERCKAFFERCREFGVTLHKSKSEMCKKEIKFCGYNITGSEVKASEDIVSGIAKFPAPKNITQMRSFFGLCNQIAHFSQDVSQALEPLRPLLKKNVVFRWMPEHDVAFEKAKTLLTSPPVLTYFDARNPTRLCTDASRLHGLGFTLEQKI